MKEIVMEDGMKRNYKDKKLINIHKDIDSEFSEQSIMTHRSLESFEKETECPLQVTLL